MISNDILSWYEASLPAKERKARGHFSTPPQLVEQMLDACGYTSDRDLSHMCVLDPACGSGNFLVGAMRRLVASSEHLLPDYEALITSIQRNIWGFDPDPVACFLAEMQLRTVLTDAYPHETLPRQFHIHQADGLAFPWQQGESVDLFLANPPYLAAKNNDLSGYRSAQGRGQADSYLLFLNLALQVVRPGGWIGLVLPDPVLARANAAVERRRLLAETTIHRLWHLAGVFAAQVGAVVIVAQKCPPPHLHQVAWQRGRWLRSTQTCEPALSSAKTVSQSLLSSQPGAELRYLLNDIQSVLLGRLHAALSVSHHERRFMPLSHFVSIRRGEELGKASPLLTEKAPPDPHAWYPLLRGGVDVRPYEIQTDCCWIARNAVIKPLERYLTPKLLIVKSSELLQAALDVQGHIVLQTLYLLIPKNGTDLPHMLDELYFLLALLNSRLLRAYVRVLYTAYKRVQPQIEQHVLASLPIPIVEYNEKRQLIERAKLLMHVCSARSSVVELKEHNTALYETQERAICALYEYTLQY